MKKTLNDLPLQEARVLLRVDFNAPIQNGRVQDNTRLASSLPTLKFLLERNAKIVIMTHLGRPTAVIEGKDNDKEVADLPKIPKAVSLKPIFEELKKLLPSVPIFLAPHVVGKEVRMMIKSLKGGEILLLENIRLHTAEQSKVASEREMFASWLANGQTAYVNDAFGTCHREHTSTATLAKKLPSAMGLLVEKEIKYFESLLANPPKHFYLILGGAKISTKLPIIKRLIDKVEAILVGGGMSYTFLKAAGFDIGQSLLEEDLLEECSDLLKKYPKKIVLPSDVKVGNFNFADKSINGNLSSSSISSIPHHLEGLDIGDKTISTFVKILHNAKLVMWNGPLGVFENPKTAHGTMSIAKFLADKSSQGCTVVVGGGETAQAAKMLPNSDAFSHISTGGGATLEMLQGKVLPGIAYIEEK